VVVVELVQKQFRDHRATSASTTAGGDPEGITI
jgi:hypothetical protein